MKLILSVSLLLLSQLVLAVELDDALAHQQAGNHKLAIWQIHELLQKEPDSPRLHLELARSLFALRQYELAAKHLRFVLSKDLPDTVRSNTEDFYTLVVETAAEHDIVIGRKSPYQFAVHFKFGYDSNSNNFPIDSPEMRQLSLTQKQEPVFYHGLTAQGSYDFEWQNWQWQTTGLVYGQNNLSAELENDIFALSLGISSQRQFSSWLVTLPVSYEFEYVNDESDEQALVLNPKVSFGDRWFGRVMLGFYHDFSANHYDYQQYELAVKYQQRIRHYSPYAELTLHKTNAEKRTDNKTSLELQLGSYAKFDKWSANLYGTLKMQNSDSNIDLSLLDREDTHWQLTTQLKYALTWQAYVGGKTQFMFNRSNQPLFEYNRNKFELNLGFNF